MANQNSDSTAVVQPVSFLSKMAIIYLLMFMFLAALINIILVIGCQYLFGVMFIKGIHLAAFFSLGIFSLHFLRKFCSSGLSHFSSYFFRITFIESLLIGAVIMLTFYITGSLQVLISTASIAAFLLPVVIYEALNSYRSLPGSEIKIWQATDAKRTKRVQYKKNTEIQFVITRKTGHIGSAPALVLQKVSPYDLLGDTFHELISNPNNDESFIIDTYDENGHIYNWCFFVKDVMLGKRWLDPFCTLRTNGIRTDKPVIVKRIKTTEK